MGLHKRPKLKQAVDRECYDNRWKKGFLTSGPYSPKLIRYRGDINMFDALFWAAIMSRNLRDCGMTQGLTAPLPVILDEQFFRHFIYR